MENVFNQFFLVKILKALFSQKILTNETINLNFNSSIFLLKLPCNF
jgi:hypothetical protein